MATFNYIIRKGKNGSAKIYIQFSYGKRGDKHNLFRSSTGFYVNDSNNWDSAKQEIKQSIREPKHKDWNERLVGLEIHFKKEFDDLLTEGEAIDNNDLKNIQDSYVHQPKVVNKIKKFDLSNLLDEWFEYCSSRKRITTGKNRGKKLEKGTVKTIKNTVSEINGFLNDNKVRSPKNINDRLYDDLLNYLEEKNLGKNTITKVVKNLKSFFNYIQRDRTDRIELPNYFAEKWIVSFEDIDDIYLTEEELMRMFHLNLQGVKESYHIARELFLISAFTGLRISDNKKLHKDNIVELEGYRFFKVRSKKSSSDTLIPIAQPVEEIIKRNGGLPKKMADQTVNRLIKDVAEWSKIDDLHTIHRTKGGKRIEEKNYKFELVKTHTGRRSFCTNAYKGGMDAISIMAVSGHTTEENFLKYIKITREEMALRNAKHDYYKNLSTNNYNSDGTRKLMAV